MKKSIRRIVLFAVLLSYLVTINIICHIYEENINETFLTSIHVSGREAYNTFSNDYISSIANTNSAEPVQAVMTALNKSAEDAYYFNDNIEYKYYLYDGDKKYVTAGYEDGIILYPGLNDLNPSVSENEAAFVGEEEGIVIDLFSYMNIEQKIEFQEFQGEDGFLGIARIDWAEKEDGTRIPTYVVFHTYNYGPEKAFVLADETTTDVFYDYNLCKDQRFDTDLDIPTGDARVIYGYSYDFLRRNTASNRKKALYSLLSDELPQAIVPHMDQFLDTSRSTFGYFTLRDSNKVYFGTGVTINAVRYAIVGVGIQDNRKVLCSGSFPLVLAGITIVYALLALVLMLINSFFLSREEDLHQYQLSFSNAAAHEMKTPIAIIKSHCECLEEGICPERHSEYIHIISEETDRLDKLTKQFLQYSRLGRIEKLEMSEGNFTELIKGEMEKYRGLFQTRKLRIMEALDEDIYISMNSEYMALAIDNLMSNIAKHAPEGCEVKIILKKEGKHGVIFTVANPYDSSAKVDFPERPTTNIWELFELRSELKEYIRHTSGMGLHIILEVMTLHGFDDELAESTSDFELSFEGKRINK